MAKSNSDIVFIGSDLGAGTMQAFKEEMPDQFFMEGISEGHIIGMASGLAMSGKIVYVNTIAAFLTRRCFEQNVIDLGLSNSNVRLIGNGGGLVYAPLGPTHLAIEDLAIMRTIPNMTVVIPSDALEMEQVILASATYVGPMYIRLAKGGDPIVSNDVNVFTIGKVSVLRSSGQVLFIANGIMVHRALQAADILEADGVSCGVLNVHTLKPLDIITLEAQIAQSCVVISIEEHVLCGGLGSAVAEIIAEKIWQRPVAFKRLALPDCFPDKYGSQDSLLAHYGLHVENIVNTARSLMSSVKMVL